MATTVLVVGASGVGKDSLIIEAQKMLENDKRFLFIKRYITREAIEEENHFFVDNEAFETLEKNNHFVATWSSYTSKYGVPYSEFKVLANDSVFIVNVSREIIGKFEKKFKNVITLNIKTNKKNITKRLLSRGREDAVEIERRVERVDMQFTAKNIIHFDNTLPLEESSKEFIHLLRSFAVDHNQYVNTECLKSFIQKEKSEYSSTIDMARRTIYLSLSDNIPNSTLFALFLYCTLSIIETKCFKEKESEKKYLFLSFKKFGIKVYAIVKNLTSAGRYLLSVNPDYKSTMNLATYKKLMNEFGYMNAQEIRNFSEIDNYEELLKLRKIVDTADSDKTLCMCSLDTLRQLIDTMN